MISRLSHEKEPKGSYTDQADKYRLFVWLARIFHKLARALTCLLINKKDFAQSGV
jgi:hypothetical protein